MNIWIRDVQSGAERQVTRLTVAATLPAWSPDAARIAFVDADGQLQVVDVKSGAVRKIHDHLNEPGRPSWSPDGSAVVVSSLKVYSTRFREGDERGASRADRRLGRSLVRSGAAQIDRHARRLRAGLVSGRHADGRHRRRPAHGVARRPRRRAARAAAAALDRSRGVADMDRRFAADSVSDRHRDEDGRRRRAAHRARDRSASDVDSGAAAVCRVGLGATDRTKTVHAGRFWDGRTDALQRDVDIVIDGNRIKSVEPHRAGRTPAP